MADAWNPIRQHCRGCNPANQGGGGRGGRLAPAAAGRGPPPPGPPIPSRISVQHNITSPTDNGSNAFSEISNRFFGNKQCTGRFGTHLRK